MKAWNVAEELHILKNMTLDSNSQSDVVKVAFQQFSDLMRILLYLHHMSNLIKIDNPQSLSTRLEIRGRG